MEPIIGPRWECKDAICSETGVDLCQNCHVSKWEGGTLTSIYAIYILLCAYTRHRTHIFIDSSRFTYGAFLLVGKHHHTHEMFETLPLSTIATTSASNNHTSTTNVIYNGNPSLQPPTYVDADYVNFGPQYNYLDPVCVFVYIFE